MMIVMKTWSVQDAKARFSEFLEAAVKHGPQVVTKRGVETAVLVPVKEWRRLNSGPNGTKPNLKELLLGPGPRDLPIPPRRKWRHRPIVEFE
jgi:antitoxin Phd